MIVKNIGRFIQCIIEETRELYQQWIERRRVELDLKMMVGSPDE